MTVYRLFKFYRRCGMPVVQALKRALQSARRDFNLTRSSE
jgi:hypothetical protein